MNYRHAFHAGNFADVFKHALLARVLTYLAVKPAPFRYLDTHAGIGRYDLGGDAAGRTGEWRAGIGAPALRAAPAAVSELLAPYLDAVGPCDPDGRPLRYPGSPALAQTLLRPQDRLALCELHTEDFRTLKIEMGRDRRVTALNLDGYQSLKALLPPPERRGLVLIDPPFEERDEFERLRAGILEAWRRWPTGSYMLWYPIKDTRGVARLAETIVAAGLRDVLQLHLWVDRTGEGPLAGCGLILVNPPFRLKAEAEVLLPVLADALKRSPAAGWSARVLAGD